MISASHNSFEFNGIKLFSSDGYKLSDDIEEEIEELILDKPQDMKLAADGEVGRITYYRDAQSDYIRYIMKCIKGNLTGLRIALDCANGSASATAKRLFEGLGASVYVINASPNGVNINENCGSTHINNLMQFVIDKKCHAGLAFDGDADRCLAVDEKGELVDGDKLIAICAKAYKEKGKLKKDTAVVTVMSNLGFTYFARNNDIKCRLLKLETDMFLKECLRADIIWAENKAVILFSLMKRIPATVSSQEQRCLKYLLNRD